MEADIRLRGPLDLSLTLSPLRHGREDPTIRVDADGSWWRAALTASGPVTLRVTRERGGIRLNAWGPGAAGALESAPDLLGLRDGSEDFDPPFRGNRGRVIRLLEAAGIVAPRFGPRLPTQDIARL